MHKHVPQKTCSHTHTHIWRTWILQCCNTNIIHSTNHALWYGDECLPCAVRAFSVRWKIPACVFVFTHVRRLHVVFVCKFTSALVPPIPLSFHAAATKFNALNLLLIWISRVSLERSDVMWLAVFCVFRTERCAVLCVFMRSRPRTIR